MKVPVDRSKTRLRFIFLLKMKSKLSRVFCESRNWACFPAAPAAPGAQGEPSKTRQKRRSMGAGSRLGLAQTGLQRGGRSAQAKLFERTIEFDQIHSSISLVL